MRILSVLSHPVWTGVSGLVAIIALFWSMGIAREVDRVTYSVWNERGASEPGGRSSGQASSDRADALGPERPRIALLIANSDYGFTELKNPKNDIDYVGQALASKGFEVIKRINIGYEETKAAISDFQGLLKLGGVGLIYYAGHALYRDGEDILLPTDIQNSIKADLSPATRGIKIGTEGSPHVRLEPPPVHANKIAKRIPGAIYLSELLAPVNTMIGERKSDSGSAVIYSASRGQIVLDGSDADPDHSPFAKAFAEAVNSQDTELFDVFRRISQLVPSFTKYRQTPSIEASLSKPFYFDRIWRDQEIGVLKIVVIDSCRTDLAVESLASQR